MHVSITHPSADSPFPYFRGKALVERFLVEGEVPYAILRPAILFGGNGVLLNNIAWLMRHLPVFVVGGRGEYRVRGIHVDDLARLCVEKGAERGDSVSYAVGPERPTFLELVTTIRDLLGSRARIVHVPGATVPVLARLLGIALRYVLLHPRRIPGNGCRPGRHGWSRYRSHGTLGLARCTRQRARHPLRERAGPSLLALKVQMDAGSSLDQVPPATPTRVARRSSPSNGSGQSRW